MKKRYATTFDEYVGWMALNSPHATVLDWRRRLECALNEYAATLRAPSRYEGKLSGAEADRIGHGINRNAFLRGLIVAKPDWVKLRLSGY